MKDVQQTSITAYNEDVRSGKIPTQRRRILEIIRQFGPMTRAEIQKKTRKVGFYDGTFIVIEEIPITSVCGRVRCLIDSDLIHVSGTKKDPTTGKTVQVLAFGPKPKLNGNQYELNM